MFPSTHWSQFAAPNQSDPQQLHWDCFVRVYGDAIRSWFLRQQQQAADADDLTQTVLLKLYQKMGLYDATKGPFRPWLVTLLRHTLLDAQRAGQRRPGAIARGAASGYELENIADEASLDDLGSRIEACGETLMQQALARVRANATAVQWQAFELHELQKRPASEVGTELGLSTGAVYQARYRLLQKLRDEYRRLTTEPSHANSLSQHADTPAVP